MPRASSKEKEKSSKSKSKPHAAPVATAVPSGNLGVKRTCPKCSTKFYDFCKEDLNCPKCNAKLKASQLVSTPNIPRAEPKKVKVPEKIIETIAPEEGAVGVAADAFESIDDLGDDDNVVEDIDVDDEDESKSDY